LKDSQEVTGRNGSSYPLDGAHLAVIVTGPDSRLVAATLARELERHLLLGERSADSSTAWLGGAESVDRSELEEAAAGAVEGGAMRLSFGETEGGLDGWRQTFLQAKEANLVAERSGESVVHYRDVALVAAALRDPVLCHHLTTTYAVPLEKSEDLVDTLASVLESPRVLSYAGAELMIARQTVDRRVRRAEATIGGPISRYAAPLETALQLSQLND
jgi:hypothetical protein